jgi:hypothetical protein
MRASGRHRLPSWILVALLLAVAEPGLLRAEPVFNGVAVSTPVLVTGAGPFADGCEGRPLASRVYRGSVVEPMLAADPKDPQHLVAAWVQDKIATAAASGVLSAVSHDGGRTWTPTFPRFSRCAGGNAANGGDYSRASDPWLSIAPNGDVYAVALAVNSFAGPETNSAISVSKSTDGGLTWGDAVAVARGPIANGFNDKATITADPADANFVYVVWDRDFEDDQTTSGLVEAPAFFSRTADGGRTWDPPRTIYSGAGARTIGHVLVVLPSGALVDVFTRGLPAAGGKTTYDLVLVRSSDRGLTWSAPQSISDIVTAPLLDPYSTFPLQPDADLATISTVAADPTTGNLHVAWQDARFSLGRQIDIAYTTSVDGGQTWSAPVRINQTSGDLPALVPTAAVSGDGTVAISYYDLRNTSAMQTGIATDFWLASCKTNCDTGAGWGETHIAGSFDLERAPYGNGFFLGDYTGMVGAVSGFALLYVSTNPAGSPTVSDASFVTVALSASPRTGRQPAPVQWRSGQPPRGSADKAAGRRGAS